VKAEISSTGEPIARSPQISVTQIRKRDGRIVSFDPEKITNAIFRAILATGGPNRSLAKSLTEQVVKVLDQRYDGQIIPSVEEVQDIVEKVLLDTGHAKTAKSYILYRQKRAELRREKRRILERDEIDEVDKIFDVNALKVLKARYLRKDESGKLIETPKQLFMRVATHATLPNLLYDPIVYDVSGRQSAHPFEEFDPAEWSGKVSVGSYTLNQHHLEALKRMYDRFDRDGHAKLPWNEFFRQLQKGDFSHFAKDFDDFFNIMVKRQFLPNTPAIANFGNVLGMGSACFVLDVNDSIESIMDALKKTAVVFKAGGGMGYNFSKLRPEGDYVSSTSGIASGPISFMMLFDTMTEVIKQGGIRRGANMGIVNSNHPDIEKFVNAKKGNRALRNFNISVLVMPDFWEFYNNNQPYPLVNPRTGEVVREVNPRLLFDMIVYQAWESAEPGVIFFDHVNKYNPFLEHLGPIVTTNPCGEVLLYPNESCNLGSINVWAFARKDANGKTFVDWDALKEAIRVATIFLDNVIDVNRFPLKDIEDMTLATRKIGLGVMGFADLLYELGIAYNNEAGRKFAEKLMEFINYYSKLASVELAKERGPLPFYEKSFYPEGRLPFSGFDHPENWNFDWSEVGELVKKHGIRNGYTTVIAPTGSISMIAGCSSGIEPVYSLVFEKNVKVGSFFYVDPVFEDVMKREGLYDEDLMREVNERGGTIQNISYIPERLKGIFVTAMDIAPEDHIRMLASFQRWVDSSISKTNNFPAEATVDDMRESYLLAYQLGCKDVTVFRDSSIKDQVLVAPKRKAPQTTTEVATEAALAVVATAHGRSSYDTRYFGNNGNGFHSNICPQCETETVFQEGCVSCHSCGWTACA
jgi:ribonucleoside-diphosphate reductase alpha chain